MLSNLLESLYNKVIVNIIIKHSSTEIYIELCSKKGVISSEQKIFETLSLSKEMLAFIDSYIKESPYYYIAILDNSVEQGAFPTCAKNRLAYFHDLSASEYKCHNSSWTYHTSKNDLYKLEKLYAKSGIDLVFSPFTLLSNFFIDKISSNIAMYLVVQETSVTLAIFDKGDMLYAHYIDMQRDEESEEILTQDLDESEDLGIDVGIDLDDIDVIDDLDDFGDIEDLDSIEDIDQFSQSQDIEEEFYESEEPVVESKDDNANGDYKRFMAVQSSIAIYYSEEKYKGGFIENTYIADGVGVSGDLKRYLEEEMFLNVYVRHIEMGMELASLAKMELNL